MTYSAKQGSERLLGVITRYKQWRFFWDLLDNESLSGLVEKLFNQLTNNQFISLFTDDFDQISSAAILASISEKRIDR